MTGTVNIIGAGRVGATLLDLTRGSGWIAQDVASRSLASAKAMVREAGVGRTVELAEIRPADLWLLTTPDGAIAQVAEALATRDLPPSVAVHCSGFHSADIMAPLRAQGWHLASLHPVRSFADPTRAIEEFAETFCGIEGDPIAVAAATAFARELGGHPFPIRSEAKALYHAAAVVSNNFTTVLQAMALELWAEAGVPAEVARSLQHNLLQGALENIDQLGPQEALTGPAARGDTTVVDAQTRHLETWNPDAADLYRLISAMAARLKETGKV